MSTGTELVHTRSKAGTLETLCAVLLYEITVESHKSAVLIYWSIQVASPAKKSLANRLLWSYSQTFWWVKVLSVQVLTWVLSYDGEQSPEPLAITAASAALCVSGMPRPPEPFFQATCGHLHELYQCFTHMSHTTWATPVLPYMRNTTGVTPPQLHQCRTHTSYTT